MEEALKANRGELRLNFQYAETLRGAGELDPDTLAYYYERSFTSGDRNYDAQFWFARFSFESADEKRRMKSKEMFRFLRTVSMPHERRVEIRDFSRDENGIRLFHGSVERLESTYGRIRRDGVSDFIFVHSKGTEEKVWESLKQGSRVSFAIGYSFAGPIATLVVPYSKL